MLKIRLSRVGKKNSPSFRIVVTEHFKPVKAGFIEHIGFYNPQNKKFELNQNKLEAWMKKGATPSTTVNNLLVREKIFAKDKVVKVTRIAKKKDEEDKKPEVKEKKKKEKIEKKEAPLRSASSAGSTASPTAKSVEKKKPRVDKK